MSNNDDKGFDDIYDILDDQRRPKEYEVEEILGSRFVVKRNGRREELFMIKWKGFSGEKERTEEPMENLSNCSELLEAFKKKQAEEAKKKPRGRGRSRQPPIANPKPRGRSHSRGPSSSRGPSITSSRRSSSRGPSGSSEPQKSRITLPKLSREKEPPKKEKATKKKSRVTKPNNRKVASAASGTATNEKSSPLNQTGRKRNSQDANHAVPKKVLISQLSNGDSIREEGNEADAPSASPVLSLTPYTSHTPISVNQQAPQPLPALQYPEIIDLTIDDDCDDYQESQQEQTATYEDGTSAGPSTSSSESRPSDTKDARKTSTAICPAEKKTLHHPARTNGRDVGSRRSKPHGKRVTKGRRKNTPKVSKAAAAAINNEEVEDSAEQRSIDKPSIQLFYTHEEKCATIVYNNADGSNGFTRESLQELVTIFKEAEANEKCCIILLRTPKSLPNYPLPEFVPFCPGIDMGKWLDSQNIESIDKLKYLKVQARIRDSAKEVAKTIREFITCLAYSKKILVAKVHGAASMLGCVMLAYFDYVYASTDATFSAPFLRCRLSNEGAAAYIFKRKMSHTACWDLLTMGRIYSADAAKSAGLINYYCNPGKLDAVVDTEIEELAFLSRELLLRQKEAIGRHDFGELEKVLKSEEEQIGDTWVKLMVAAAESGTNSLNSCPTNMYLRKDSSRDKFCTSAQLHRLLTKSTSVLQTRPSTKLRSGLL